VIRKFLPSFFVILEGKDKMAGAYSEQSRVEKRVGNSGKEDHL
jgi:hypothetical protein